DVEFDADGVLAPVYRSEPPVFSDPTLSLSIFRGLFGELPQSGSMATTLASPGDLLDRLAADFPVHAHFDDADIFETNEMLVLVSGPRGANGERGVAVFLRRPVPLETVPGYLFGKDDGSTTSSSGLLGPPRFRQQLEEEADRYPRWTSVLRRREPEN